jgi:polar amino acid transport system substrate-binding protein
VIRSGLVREESGGAGCRDVREGTEVRKILVALGMLTLLLTGCAKSTTPAASPAPSGTALDCSASKLNLLTPGQLTVGTDNPAYQPWFAGTGKYGPWKGVPGNGTGNPASGQGYESGVAYAVAQQLGFTNAQVKWVPIGFNESFKPGPKNFDFYLAQVSATPERAQAVTFSDSYYDVNQAIIANKGTPIAGATSIADLQKYKLGVQVGTTSYDFVQNTIKPTQQPLVYDNSNDVIAALNAGQVDGIVTDAPDAYVIVLIGEAKHGVVVGQFANQGEHFGLVFSKGNPLAACVDKAIATLKSNGTLASLQSKWLADLSYPVLH